MVHRRADKHSGTTTDSTEYNVTSKKGAPVGRLSGFLGSLCFLGLFVVLMSSGGTKSVSVEGMAGAATQKKQEITQKKLEKTTTASTKTKTVNGGKPSTPMADYYDFSPAVAKYDNCEVKWQPPLPEETWNTKPLWMPAHPGSGMNSPAGTGDIMSPLIKSITGLKAGAKNYHASSKALKRCKGVDETAVCTNGHPVTGVGPEKQVANFYHSVILVVRNCRTVFPVFWNDKNVAYHQATEPLTEEEWRISRDQWFQPVLNGWKGVISTWRNMTEYDVGLWVQYEKLMDPERGPAVVERIADLLHKAGFTVAPKEDLPCMWYKIVKREYDRLEEALKYSYGYTKEQRDDILQQLIELQEEVADDKEIHAILQEYIDDVRDNTYIDVPAQKGPDDAQ